MLVVPFHPLTKHCSGCNYRLTVDFVHGAVLHQSVHQFYITFTNLDIVCKTIILCYFMLLLHYLNHHVAESKNSQV